MKPNDLRRNVLLVVLAVALVILVRARQPNLNDKSSSRTEPTFAYDFENRPIAATLIGPQFGDDDLLRIAGIPWLQRIVLAESRVTRRSLESLANLPKIKSLDLSGTTLTDDDFLAVTKLTTLAELMLNDCPWLRDEHLSGLAEMKQLRKLEFSSPEITDKGLRVLEQLPELKTLVVGDCSDISEAVIETLKKLPQLRAITLAGANLSSQTVFALRSKLPDVEVKADYIALKDLRTLAGKGHLSDDAKSFHAAGYFREKDEPLVPGDMSVIGSIAPLDSLALKGPITDEMFYELKPAPNLRSLQLLDSLITDDGLEHLVHFPKLQSLSMFPTRLTGRGLVHLRHTPQLERLEIRTSLGDEVLEHFAPLQELNELGLGAPVTDAGLERLPVLPKLRSLYFNDSNITGPGLVHLAKQPELVSLGLGRCPVTDIAIDALVKLAKLKFAYGFGGQISEEGKARLKELRPDIELR